MPILRICDCESHLRWYLIKKSYFEGFLKSEEKVKIFDLESKLTGAVDKKRGFDF